MRQNTAYYFLLLYLMVLCKPLLPLAADAASHFFANAHHQITVHARYGQNHLDKDLADAGTDGKHQQQVIQTADTAPHQLPTPVIILSPVEHQTSSLYPAGERSHLPQVAYLPEAPPPKMG